MKTQSISKYLLYGILSLVVIGPMATSCASKKHMTSGWVSLDHARELDKKKGMRSKKYQKNVTHASKN